MNYFGSNILMGVETKMVSENLRNANSMQIPYVSAHYTLDTGGG